MSPAANRTLGPYELLESVGSGAVGDVYRARDPRLGRDVAIKVLNRNVAGGLSRQERFQQEARAVSALNHPNILTVYDVGSDGANPYIVSEYLDGESLRKVIERGPLPLRRLLDIAVQIAEGLAAAHEAGIIHRDLKPENIMITRTGRAKILDFGLAKPILEGGAEETLSNEATAPGLLIGTAAYMSPEQARGSSSLSAWSDQFSFGLILYEMASGKQAFRRPSPLETLSAILSDDAPEVPVGPFPFKWLVMRCLHKQPDHRYRSTADLVRELRTIRDSLTASWDTEPEVPADPPRLERHATVAEPTRRFHLTELVWALLLLAAGAAGFAAARLTDREPPFSPARQQFTPFASGPGYQGLPAWSASGRALAWSGETGGVLQIFIRADRSARATQLTNGTADCLTPFWSADASRVYYVSQNALWSAGLAGGAPQKIADGVAAAGLSLDGRTLALLRPASSGLAVWTAGPDGSNLRRYAGAPEAAGIAYLRWKPDGSAIGLWASVGAGSAAFSELPWPEGTPKTRFQAAAARPFAWMTDGRVVYTERDLIARDLNGGGEQRLSATLRDLAWPTVSPDGRRIAFTAAEASSELVRIRLSGSGSEPMGGGESPAVSANGELAWVAEAGGRPEIRLRFVTGGGERTLISTDQFDGATTSFADLDFAPDGRRLAFRRAGADGAAIWITTVNGDSPVRLTSGRAPESGPSWSPDGSRIVYSSFHDRGPALLVATVGSPKAPELLARGAWRSARWSPDGSTVAAIGTDGSVALKSVADKRVTSGPGGPWVAIEWKRGSGLYGLRRAGAMLQLARIDTATKTGTAVRDVGPWPADWTPALAAGEAPAALSALADGSGFFASLRRTAADVWVLSER